jgi:hypothetical protein
MGRKQHVKVPCQSDIHYPINGTAGLKLLQFILFPNILFLLTDVIFVALDFEGDLLYDISQIRLATLDTRDIMPLKSDLITTKQNRIRGLSPKMRKKFLFAETVNCSL